MNLIDKLYTEWAWRSKTGTPSMDNPEDKAILENLFKELELDTKPVLSEAIDFPAALEKAFDSQIPAAEGSYEAPTQSGVLTITNENDKKVWKELFNNNAGNNTVGPGELALYWLYNFQKNPVVTKANHDDADPDLSIGTIKTEVKSYGTHNGKITLGKFGDQKSNLRALTIIFGIQALSAVLRLEDKGKVVRPTSFRPVELEGAFEYFFKLKDSPALLESADQFELIRSIKEKVEFVERYLGSPKSPRMAASRMIGKIAEEKLKIKPGNKNYIASVLESGEIYFFLIDFAQLKQDIFDKVTISAGEIKVDFMSIFGKSTSSGEREED